MSILFKGFIPAIFCELYVVMLKKLMKIDGIFHFLFFPHNSMTCQRVEGVLAQKI